MISLKLGTSFRVQCSPHRRFMEDTAFCEVTFVGASGVCDRSSL